MTEGASVAPMSRPYDVLLFGATGFTGRLVADYLARNAVGLRWAIGGRNPSKLEEVKASLGDRGKELDVLRADSGSVEDLEKIVAKARVVCTTVGPYAKYGHKLASACAAHGTHYCDITGETHFVRASIDQNDARARETHARIVHCCGFDSIPSDLGALLLADHARERHGDKLARARFVLMRMRGGASGGTIASMLNILEEAESNRSLRRLMADPYALSPDRAHDLDLDGADQATVAWDEEAHVWTGPFVMAAINTRVVRRSNALLGHLYGARFRYGESMAFGPGPAGFAKAATFTAGLGAFLVAASRKGPRAVLARWLPKPGEGPSREQREAGYFKIRFFAETEGARRLRARVEGTSDPGYGETAKMLAESALCLAEGSFAWKEGGVLTPAVAMGQHLVARLRSAGMTLEVEG